MSHQYGRHRLHSCIADALSSPSFQISGSWVDLLTDLKNITDRQEWTLLSLIKKVTQTIKTFTARVARQFSLDNRQDNAGKH